MKLVLKLTFYVVLLGAAVIAFGRFRTAYQQGHVLGASESAAGAVDPTSSKDAGLPDAEALAVTNLAVTQAGATNRAGTATNTDMVQSGVTPALGSPHATSKLGNPRVPPANSSPLVYLGAFVISLLLVAALGAWDFAQYLGNRTERAMMATDFELPNDPTYDAAEEEWSKGNHLGAINLMREYLKLNPNEQHVAIRIAEIYEKELNNHLAAALELEEVLTRKLPREKWGWTAIHLANLYSGKLNRPPKAMAWLERITNDYPETAAAKKARQRLGLPEPENESAREAATVSKPPPEPEPPTNLPKGFRTKK